ncbi:MAG TPA: hypothetical protein QF353_01460 [Gammaproteobacteria bacterium]|nr:hypothetical protein [Gammaproteobacteria bacterium]
MPKDYANNFTIHSNQRGLWFLFGLLLCLIPALGWFGYKYYPIQPPTTTVHTVTLPKDIEQWTAPNGGHFLIAFHHKTLETGSFKQHLIQEGMSLIGPFKTLKETHQFIQNNPAQYTQAPKIIYLPHTTHNTGITP